MVAKHECIDDSVKFNQSSKADVKQTDAVMIKREPNSDAIHLVM